MDISVLLISFNLVSAVSAFVFLQPPDGTTTAQPQHKTNTSSQLENTENNKSVELPKVTKDTSRNEKEGFWSVLEVLKRTLIKEGFKVIQSTKKPNNVYPKKKPKISTSEIPTSKKDSTHAGISKSVKNVEPPTKSVYSLLSHKNPTKENPIAFGEGESYVEATSGIYKSSFSSESPSKEVARKTVVVETASVNNKSFHSENLLTKVEKIERKGKTVKTAAGNVEPSFPSENPSKETHSTVKTGKTAAGNVEPSFPSENPSKEAHSTVKMVETDTMNVNSSLPSNGLSQENYTKANYVKNATKTVLVMEPLHSISSKNDSIKSIAPSNYITCGSKLSFCIRSQECVHDCVCTFVLIFTSSLFFYHMISAFK